MAWTSRASTPPSGWSARAGDARRGRVCPRVIEARARSRDRSAGAPTPTGPPGSRRRRPGGCTAPRTSGPSATWGRRPGGRRSGTLRARAWTPAPPGRPGSSECNHPRGAEPVSPAGWFRRRWTGGRRTHRRRPARAGGRRTSRRARGQARARSTTGRRDRGCTGTAPGAPRRRGRAPAPSPRADGRAAPRAGGPDATASTPSNSGDGRGASPARHGRPEPTAVRGRGPGRRDRGARAGTNTR